MATVPRPVHSLNLTAGPGNGGLTVSWSSDQGDLDFYTVMLFKGTHMQDVRNVPKHITQKEFHNLVPGQLYSVTVQSVSGTLTNNRTTSGRTGKKHKTIWVFIKIIVRYRTKSLVGMPSLYCIVLVCVGVCSRPRRCYSPSDG